MSCDNYRTHGRGTPLLLGLLATIALSVSASALAENVAITFDDLPLNGALPPNTTRTQIVQRVVTILKRNQVPPVYGFVNAQRFEGIQDGAEALKLWVASGELVGNHTYSHPDLNKESSELFLSDVYLNEPVLELLSKGAEWRWLRYPFLREGDTLDKRRSVRAGLRERGYRIAQVTLDYEDYLWNSPYARCLGKADAATCAGFKLVTLEDAQKTLHISQTPMRRRETVERCWNSGWTRVSSSTRAFRKSPTKSWRTPADSLKQARRATLVQLQPGTRVRRSLRRPMMYGFPGAGLRQCPYPLSKPFG